MKKVYSFGARVWLWPGIGGWHFVNVPDSISKDIRKNLGKGMIKIFASVGKTKWGTSLFPHKNSKAEFGYLISVKKIIRKKENIFENDTIKVVFNLK
ncbi:MAG: hypothetical protein AB198_00375 [Parcubacteria bacterium C7867-003]|nr:MAG: hypothetical protein AB198_00375 [Parcubacteria bacterium C7867-003]